MRAVPYELRTDLLGVVARHADNCPARDGETCRCGPLGFRSGIWDWDRDRWVFGPLVRTTGEAREWQWTANRTDGAQVHEEEANSREQFAWWAFCYIGLGFVGLAVGLSTAALAG